MDPEALSAKRPRTFKHPLVEETVAFWVLQCKHHGVALTTDIIRTEYQRFAKSFDIPEDMIAFSQG